MEQLIIFVISNFTLTFFVLSLLFAGVSLAFKPRPLQKATVIDILFSYYLLFNIGISSFYNFVMHVFFGEMAAQFIGWSQSPFQLEVGFASLGFAVVGVISFFGGLGFRAATVIAPAMFLWGAAGGHIYQMIVAHNFAPGNAGVIFWSDIFLPIIGFALLWLQYRNPERGRRG
ncbi:DUF6790 family protein [Legionella spiritensis]|uniref:Transmembrane protein n=1 Tax=Legionella spiritensis TaxID=452 RepID=A0A0W0YXY1_LEGSP|nr:DUF6790 family protein [Legionella spiritensis]KTD61724.1 hypothetical protein Lspi_2354 [Legionella spiritensis]SNV38752.1 Uncharacterised protein [Legionella spiritensis]